MQASLQTPFMIKLMLALWLFNLVNWYLAGSVFNLLGLVPRRLFGLMGIVFSPILHADFNHLFFNSFPLFILGLFVLVQGLAFFLWLSASIMFLSGSIVWLLGRTGNHIGASSLITGYFAFLLSQAYQDPGLISLILAGVSIYYFGGIFFSLFPSSQEVSWEGHLSGFWAGLLCTYYITIS